MGGRFVMQMNAVVTKSEPMPPDAVAELMVQYGKWAVLRAAVGLIFAGKPKEIKVLPAGMSDYLLRDIGVPPRERARNYWEIR